MTTKRRSSKGFERHREERPILSSSINLNNNNDEGYDYDLMKKSSNIRNRTTISHHSSNQSSKRDQDPEENFYNEIKPDGLEGPSNLFYNNNHHSYNFENDHSSYHYKQPNRVRNNDSFFANNKLIRFFGRNRFLEFEEDYEGIGIGEEEEKKSKKIKKNFIVLSFYTINNLNLNFSNFLKIFMIGLNDSLSLKVFFRGILSNRNLMKIIITNLILHLGFFMSLNYSIKVKDTYNKGKAPKDLFMIEALFEIFWLTIVSLGSLRINELIMDEFLSIKNPRNKHLNFNQHNNHSHNDFNEFSYSSPSSISLSNLKGRLKDSINSKLDKILNILNYLVLSRLIFTKVPILGSYLNFWFSCVFNSFYCFENVWKVFFEVEFDDRNKEVEEDWVYHFGFGFLITLLTSSLFSSSDLIIDLMMFTITFPTFLIVIILQIDESLKINGNRDTRKNFNHNPINNSNYNDENDRFINGSDLSTLDEVEFSNNHKFFNRSKGLYGYCGVRVPIFYLSRKSFKLITSLLS